MDGFGNLSPPPEYDNVSWLTDAFVVGMGIGWLINYAGMIWHSYRGETYSMSIIPLCCNIGWELVYTAIYPSKNPTELAVFTAGLSLNLVIILAATRAAKTEWKHSPLVANNTPLVFAGGIAICFVGHIALAEQIGPELSYSWGAVICQLLLSTGGLCQLLQRNSTRGTSFTLWISRFAGSCCTVGFAFLRWLYWHEVFGWLGSPLVLWSLGSFVLIDVTYGICLYQINKAETAAAKGRMSGMMQGSAPKLNRTGSS